MKEHMLPALRTEVGLGSPPEPYYQNKSESMNEVIKDQVQYQESELPEFIKKVSCIGERHKDLLRKAVARTGEWELRPGFRFLERPNWFKMTSQQREAHMKVVMKIELSEDRTLAMLILPQASSTLPLLSTGYDQIPHISSFTLKKLWREARELVASPGYVLPVAGSSCSFAKQVFNSKQPSKPLLVTRRPTKQSATCYVFECDPVCPQYSYLGLCCHTVATAESNKVLKEYIDFLEKNTALPNLHQLSLKFSGRKGAGRKGGKPVRGRARASDKQPVLDTTFSRPANFSSNSPNVEQGVKENIPDAASEDNAGDSQLTHTSFPMNTTRSAENQQETHTSSSKFVTYTGFPIGSLSFSENQQDQQVVTSPPLSCSGFHVRSASFSREQQQQQQPSTSSQIAFGCVSAGTTHIVNQQKQQQKPSKSSHLAFNRVAAGTTHTVSQQQYEQQSSTSAQLAYDGYCTGATSFANEQQQQQSSTLSQFGFNGFPAQTSSFFSQQHQEQQPSTSSQRVLDSFTFGTTTFGDNQLPQQKQQLSVCPRIAYAYPNLPTDIMSANPYECQQPATSFSGWFPQQTSYGELPFVANKEAPSTRFSPSPKPGFPSPPDGVFYCYLLEFCPPQVSKCYGCNQGLKPEGRVAQPPFNLVIVTKMNRTYYSNGEKNCKLSNVYFHCRLKCVRQKQPYFLPTMCKIPPNLTPFLLPCHRDVFNNL